MKFLDFASSRNCVCDNGCVCVCDRARALCVCGVRPGTIELGHRFRSFMMPNEISEILLSMDRP